MQPRKEVISLGIAMAVVALLPSLLGQVLKGPSTARAADQAPKVANPHGEYREDCSLCHRASGWKPARISKKFDHDKFLPLGGAHASVDCMQCHKSLDFGGVSTACVDCHADVHNGELGTDCSRCHGTRSFVDRNDQIRLHRLTRFPLAGAHTTLDCEMCHRLTSPGDLSYVNTAAECVSCHMDDYQATVQPDHEAGGFSQDCQLCHDQLAWSHANFDHALTAFPLTGAHAVLPCADCHVGGTYTGLSSACVSCHQSDYDGTTNPTHAASGFPTTCEQCHNTTRWGDARFNHATTGFALTGAHVPLPCADCHVGGSYTGLSGACVSCHQNDYDGTSDPNHAAASFTTDCLVCHNTTRWDGAAFDHSAFFPIASGRHSNWNACSDCHTNAANYADFSCFGCHPHDDQAKTDGDHQGENGYSYQSSACYNCHPQGRT